MHHSTATTAVLLGIVAVRTRAPQALPVLCKAGVRYRGISTTAGPECLMAQGSRGDWQRLAGGQPPGSLVSDALLINAQIVATMAECPTRVLAFVGAASCFLVLRAPVAAFFATSCVYGCFYASFLNKARQRSPLSVVLSNLQQVDRPESVLKVEFLGEVPLRARASCALQC
jgi:hypothetical protein